MKKNIIYLTTSLNRGGAEKQIYDVTLALKAKGHNVSIIMMLYPVDMYYYNKLIQAGMHIECLDMSYNSTFPSIRSILALASLVRKIKPDVLHSHMVTANLLARFVKLIFPKLKVINTNHTSIKGYSKIRRLLFRLTNFLSDEVTCVSQLALNEFLKNKMFSLDRSRTVYNGIDFERYQKSTITTVAEYHKSLNLNSDIFVWIAVGRMSEAKNYFNLVDAVKLIDSNDNTSLIKVLMVGDGELNNDVKAYAEENDVSSIFVFLGKRDDVIELMSCADAYVMSSSREGLPMVLLEACAIELPIVATNVGGTSEIVKSNENGFLVESNNATELAGCMLSIMEMDKTQRERLGAKGREIAIEKFDINSVVELWEDIYQ